MTTPDMYQAPHWSQTPCDHWQIVEIKAGQEVDTHVLKASVITFGRAADHVTIPLGHESCSRLHARIAFDVSGRPWLRDLASTHGVTVNKRRLPPEASSKVEPVDCAKKGSRGVMLFPGDFIQFGASSRMYIVEGPVEMERGALEIKQKLQSIQQHKSPVPIRPSEDPFKNSPEEVTQDDPATALEKLDPSKLSDGLRKHHESIQIKKVKLEHIATESERILAKKELTDGQARQLAFNRERMIKMQEEVAGAEQELYEKIYGKIKSQQEKQFAATDEDDVDDRTASKRPRLAKSGIAYDEVSLIQQWKAQRNEWIQSRLALEKARSKHLQLNQEALSMSKDDDEFFFRQNDVDLAQENHTKSEEKKKWLELDLKETENLLVIVNDKLQFDRESGYIGIGSTGPNDKLHLNAMPPPDKEQMDAMPPPTSVIPPLRGIVPPPTTNMLPPRSRPMPPPPNVQLKTAMPPPETMTAQLKRPRLEPMMPPPSSKESMPAPVSIGPARSAPAGTLAFLSAGSKLSNKTVQKDERMAIDDKNDVWVAPQGQDGSGRTKLNEKFGSRY